MRTRTREDRSGSTALAPGALPLGAFGPPSAASSAHNAAALLKPRASRSPRVRTRSEHSPTGTSIHPTPSATTRRGDRPPPMCRVASARAVASRAARAPSPTPAGPILGPTPYRHRHRHRRAPSKPSRSPSDRRRVKHLMVHSVPLAARAARWSARHRKTAILDGCCSSSSPPCSAAPPRRAQRSAVRDGQRRVAPRRH